MNVMQPDVAEGIRNGIRNGLQPRIGGKKEPNTCSGSYSARSGFSSTHTRRNKRPIKSDLELAISKSFPVLKQQSPIDGLQVRSSRQT